MLLSYAASMLVVSYAGLLCWLLVLSYAGPMLVAGGRNLTVSQLLSTYQKTLQLFL